jgi:hypothetical protein
MNGGEISGNTASHGGGVSVSDGTFVKQSGGVIYGSNASDSSLRNTAGDGDSYGHAVYVDIWPAKIRNATAGSGVTLDSSLSGAAGGWETGASIQVTLQPQPGDPPLVDTSIFVDESAEFSAAGTEYASWQWYWQGRPINGATSATYTLPANSNLGIYEVVVVVTTDSGAKLSARCRVTIKEKQ